MKKEPDKKEKAIGAIAKDYRLARGWSLEEMAAYTGVSSSTLCRIESGASTPSRRTNASLLRSLGRSSAHLPNSESVSTISDFRPITLDDEVLGECLKALERANARDEDGVWMIIPGLSTSDWRIRVEILRAVCKATAAGFVESGSCALSVAETVGAFDVHPEVRSAADELHRSRMQAQAGLTYDQTDYFAKTIFDLQNTVPRTMSDLRELLDHLSSPHAQERAAAITAICNGIEAEEWEKSTIGLAQKALQEHAVHEKDPWVQFLINQKVA